MWRSLWFWLVLIVAGLGSALAWGLRTTTEVQVSTAPVTGGQITRRILATGTLEAVTTVEVGAQVSGVIASLAFRPPPDLLAAIGEVEPPPSSAASGADGTVRSVWAYDGRQFTPIAVRAGGADEGWTELVSGAIRPGDELVTGAVLQRRL